MRTDGRGCSRMNQDAGSLRGGTLSDPKAEARGRFGEAIADLWLRSGQMKIKEIAKRSGYSATTVSDILHGKRLPKKEVAQDIVSAFNGDFSELADLWKDLSRSVHNAIPIAPHGVEDVSLAASWYATNSEFYAACRQSVIGAARDIRVTYIRQFPPDEVTSAEAADYFAAILNWAAEPGARSATRVFGVPADSSIARTKLLKFLRQHLEEINQRDLRNYTPLVYEYTARADGLNMALFDEDVSFLAISAGYSPQTLSGIRIDSIKYTRSLVTYFNQLSSGCTPLADYLAVTRE
jgi:transcriptional regulator with XRE-family HTH domain